LPDVTPSDGSGQTRRFMILVADWWPLGAYRGWGVGGSSGSQSLVAEPDTVLKGFQPER